MRSKKSHEGYLLIDLREAPGPSLEEIAKTGKKFLGAGMRGKFETGVVTCAHCQTQVLMNPQRERERGYCAKCDHYVCDRPECNAACFPFKKVVEIAHNAANGNGSVDPLWAIRKLREDILF